jgi:replication fork protection complex subunit Tof1/Swi1
MPKAVMPEDIDATIRVMRDFLTNPIDLEGRTAAELLRNKRKKAIKRKKQSAAVVDSENDEVMVERPTKRIKKRAAELQQFKSAAYIEDSDDAAEADEGFYQRELELREISRQKMMNLGHVAVVDDNPRQPRSKTQKKAAVDTQMEVDSDDDQRHHGGHATASIPNDSDDDTAHIRNNTARPLGARPAPRRRTKRTQVTASPSGGTNESPQANQFTGRLERNSDSENDAVGVTQRTSTKRRVVAESEEDD